ncbi:formate/nitrite transporter family protein [Cellulosilyticum sp. I15G10I2]|uniref:formate/nitrite transporter family protein n=1 Tax=Cellulosilyticum sp. I15G10I2 TaxID=1892843 RepID=UPI00085BEA14|nr:formate/nitrite transporter family protein [Cellulosilyticum sp. I15G10I2]
MYKELIDKISDVGVGKVNLLKASKLKYFILSMLAGIYVGIGILLIFSIGGLVGDIGFRRIIMGLSFGIALSLVIMAGGELFTGNNMIMTVASLNQKVSWIDTIKVWVYSYIGNLAGSILIAWLFVRGGGASGSVGEFIIKASELKMTGDFWELFYRGILCNMLVCLAILTSIKLKEETAKLIMIFWCLFAFITSGFEHSVANMTLLSMGLLIPNGGVLNIGGFLYNMVPVTLGNMIGGAVIVGISYWIVGKDKI